MTGAGLLAIAERALAGAPGETQVTVTQERSLLARFARSAPTQATAVEEVEVEVLCVRDGHTASATTNRLDADALATTAARAGAAVAALATGGPGGYPGLPAPAAVVRGHDGWDAETASMDPDRAGAALRAAFEVAERRGLEAHGVWSAGEVTTAVASSSGIRGVDAVTDVFMKAIARDAAGRAGCASAAGSAAREIDAAALAQEAAAKVVAGAPVDLAAGEYPVVLDVAAVAVLLDFLGLLAFNGQAFAEGRSALSGRLGTRVAAPAVNLSDTPRFAGTLPRAFDAEGVPKAPIPLIQDGVAHRVVHDTRSAAAAGGSARSTGHALAAGGAPGGPAPTNLVLVGGGAASIDELAEPIERGIYVTRLWYVNPVSEKDTLLTGMTRDGTFLIEDGRITRPLRDVRFTDSVLRILGAVQALTDRPRLAGEGEFYGRRFATGVVCPALRAGGFRVTGATQ